MFDQWSEKDWNKFDNYMIRNVQKFLNNGLIKIETINAEVKRMIQATSKDFMDWADEQTWEDDVRLYIKHMYDSFVEEFDNKKLSKVWFSRWVYKYLDFREKVFENGRDNFGKFIRISTKT